MSVNKQEQIAAKIKHDDPRKSPTPGDGPKQGSKPVLAKTDFSLQQQMAGFNKCKDLEDWLMGSGESAETAASKVVEQPKEQGDWMFKTFDQVKPADLKPADLDSFGANDEEDLSDDDFMLGGGMHLLAKPQPDYVGQVAEKCVDLN